MKSPFSLAAFIFGLILLVTAKLIAIATLINASEAHPLAVVTFLIAAIVNIPEMPIGNFVSNLGFPIVLPTLTVILGAIGIQKKEPRKVLAMIGIVCVVLTIAVYLFLRTLG